MFIYTESCTSRLGRLSGVYPILFNNTTMAKRLYINSLLSFGNKRGKETKSQIHDSHRTWEKIRIAVHLLGSLLAVLCSLTKRNVFWAFRALQILSRCRCLAEKQQPYDTYEGSGSPQKMDRFNWASETSQMHPNANTWVQSRTRWNPVEAFSGDLAAAMYCCSNLE